MDFVSLPLTVGRAGRRICNNVTRGLGISVCSFLWLILLARSTSVKHPLVCDRMAAVFDPQIGPRFIAPKRCANVTTRFKNSSSLTRPAVYKHNKDILSPYRHPGPENRGCDPPRYDPHDCMKVIHACPDTMTMSPSDIRLSERATQLAETFADYQRTSIWSPYLALCNEKDGGLACRARIDRASLFIDSDHFSVAGARYLYPFFLNHVVQTKKEFARDDAPSTER